MFTYSILRAKINGFLHVSYQQIPLQISGLLGCQVRPWYGVCCFYIQSLARDWARNLGKCWMMRDYVVEISQNIPMEQIATLLPS